LTALWYTSYVEHLLPKLDGFTAVDLLLHGRNYSPTKVFENAVKKAEGKSSKIVRVYGRPVLSVDWDTSLVYLTYRFSPEIEKKLMDGTLTIPSGIVPKIDNETQMLIKEKEKRRLKNITRVWHKHR